MSTKIFTASWRAEIPAGAGQLVSISRSAPRGRSGFRAYRPLMPGSWFRDQMDAAVWAAKYELEVLGRLDPHKVVTDLFDLAGGEAVLLMCWEAPPPDQAWCHRALASRWLERELGLAVPEFGHEGCGCGAAHPKLPPSMRKIE